MSFTVYVRGAAELDVAKAQKWYEEQLIGLASDLHHEFALVMARLAETPFIYPAVYRNIRRAVLHRFPFLVWYHVVGSTGRRKDPRPSFAIVAPPVSSIV